jgi:malonyl-CoA O-methyltransferase
MISTALVRKHFNRAAATYDDAAVLQRELTARLLERFDVIKVSPQRILDVGCGTGAALAGLQARFPDASIVAVDLAENMVRKAVPKRSKLSQFFRRNDRLTGLCADFSHLPFANASFDLIVSNFALHWSPDLPATMKELGRVLAVDGLLSFTVPGPDTLKQLRKVTQAVHSFPDMHDVGDMLVYAGLADPVMDRDDMTLTYSSPEGLLRDMKALGTTFATPGSGLMGKSAFLALKAGLDAQRVEGLIPATYEVVSGHAWKVAPKKTEDGRAIVQFDPKARGRV